MSDRPARSITQLNKELRTQRPGITLGVARYPVDPDSDHTPWVKDSAGNGVYRAVDIMTTDGDRLAANLAAKLGRHPAMTSGAYVIWKQRIISADRKGEGWRAMSDRGSPTANHMDHVHLSVARAQAAYDFTGKWGALFAGTGDGAAPIPAGTPGAMNTDPTGTADTRPGTPGDGGRLNAPGQAGTQIAGIPDVEDIAESITTLVITAGALMLGAALVALGAARVSKPARDAVQDTTGQITQKAALAFPPTRAASAATAVTKGR